MIREAVGRGRWAIAMQLILQRLLRYLVPVGLVMTLVGAAGLAPLSVWGSLLFWLQILFYSAALMLLLIDRLGIALPKVSLVPSYFLMVNAAAAIGLAQGLSRGQSSLWQKER